MRIEHPVPALILAVIAGTTLIGCQRKGYVLPDSNMAAPSRRDDRAARPAEPGDDNPARLFVHPYVPHSFDPHQLPAATRRDRVEA